MNAVRKDVEYLVNQELTVANKKFPLFQSDHEAAAVIREELEEAQEALEELEKAYDVMWVNIKCNYLDASAICSENLHKIAVDLACEAIQVAAMAKKLVASRKEDKA